MNRWLRGVRNERGFAMVAVLSVLLILTVLSGLVLYVSGKEVRLGATRRLGSQSIYIAEGGGFAARSALMVLVNEDPTLVVNVDSTLTGTLLATWYAAGAFGSQNPLAIFDYFVLDGLRYSFAPTSATPSLNFEVDWGLPQVHRKLRVATGTPPVNSLGTGTYQATLVVNKRLAPHPFDAAQPNRYIQQLGPDSYELFYSYTITSDGQVDPRSRRRVVLSGNFSVRVRHQNFARYALFTHVHTTPSGSPIWFTSRTSFDGPVHTNGQFRFAYFPKFSDRLTSVSTSAWFNNAPGSPVMRTANENVVSGVRRDAPVMPDGTPSIADDNDNAPANFTRGVPAITVPPNSFNQRAISIGIDPTDLAPNTWTSSQWNLAIRQSVPELVDNSTAVPNGIYVPVEEGLVPNGISDPGEAMLGGIYVQGDLTSMTMSTAGATNELAVYTMVQGAQTVTVTVDRALGTTTVSNTAWGVPNPRLFNGVPKGWQVPGNDNASVIYVRGNILGLSGTLEEKEQATITSSGRIDISNHILYEDPPNLADPNDNPLNVLGLYSASNDIRITTAAPNDLIIHAVLMAGQPGVSDGYNSSVYVQDYNLGSPRGTVQMVGGLVEEYYGAFGTFDPGTGATLTGYGRDFKFDDRLQRGIAPPYFPTSTLFEVVNGSDRMAGVRPIWREAAP